MRSVVVVCLIGALACGTAAAGTLGAPSMSPASIPARTASEITFTVSITDPNYTAGTANVQRLTAAGGIASVVGNLRDDGTQGDAQAGDRIYTLRTTLQQADPGTMMFQVSAGFKGELKRSFAGPLALTVSSAQTPVIGAVQLAPAATPAGVGLLATVTAQIDNGATVASSVALQKLDANGAVLATLGQLHDDGAEGDSAAGDKTYTLRTTVLENQAGTVHYRVAATFPGTSSPVYSAPLSIAITGTATGITITSPGNGSYLNTPVLTLHGNVGDSAAQVKINGIATPLSNKSFAASVPLNEGPNILTAVAANSNGSTSTTSILVTLDTTPPKVEIYSPAAGGSTGAATVTVTGVVNDIVVGTVNPQQATVTVNGIAAEVVNRTFMARDVPLAVGANTIQAVATDRAGNRATTTASVSRAAPGLLSLAALSGNNQAARVGSALPAPLVAKLTNSQGAPEVNKPVVFRVIGLDGTLSAASAAGAGTSAIAVNTDAQGQAKAYFKLGSRAGAGNNLVEASAAGVASTADFVASGSAGGAQLVVVDSGNNQYGVVGQALPLPFIAIVTDASNNRLRGVPVTFKVIGGGGGFGAARSPTTQATSDSDGRVATNLFLGPEPGVNNNVVEVSFTGNTGAAAAFSATAMVPGPANETRISGVVLDNSNQPLPGVTMRLLQINQGNASNIPQEMAPAVRTNAQGQFVMTGVPVGIFKLMADGGTAQRAGVWPTLDFDMITVSGRDNTVGMPIFLPEVNPANRVCVNETTGGTVTIPEVPGFALTIAPGSATFPGGSRSGCVSVTPVNIDKVPMSPGFGQQPRFVVTIQPAGTHFSPAARMTMPNVDGLAPRAVTEMYSYDHDLASFVAIGSATVSADGSTITSDLGSGVIKAGWHCGGNPNTTGSAGTCPTCQKCEGASCIADAAKDGQVCEANPRKICRSGICTPTTLSVNITTPPGAFSISTVPAMPVLSFSAQAQGDGIDPGAITYKWYLTINFDSHGRADSHRLPATGTTSVTGNGTWQPALGTLFAGGNVKVFVEASADGKTATDSQDGYRINGLNPSEATIKAYLGTSPWFLPRLVRQESSFRQFAASPGEPLWGTPNGWGVMQTDPPANELVLWNWHEAIDRGKIVLDSKRASATTFWDRQVAQYTTWIAAHPNTAAPPPDTTYSDITFGYSSGTSYRDAIWIKQYNGADRNFISWDNVTDPTNPRWAFNTTNSSGHNYVSLVCNRAP